MNLPSMNNIVSGRYQAPILYFWSGFGLVKVEVCVTKHCAKLVLLAGPSGPAALHSHNKRSI